MSKNGQAITFTLDGREVQAAPGETIWQVAKREGVEIPHLCYAPEPGYRADGNCRACMVEIEGERVLAASCVRKPSPGMKVSTGSERAKNPDSDRSHPAMAVNLDACIHCNLCVRACREVQVNDVIGMAARSLAVWTFMPGVGRRTQEAASTRSPSTSTMQARQLPSGL